MIDFFTKLITLIYFIMAMGFFYAAITVTYPTIFINLILICISIFVLLQGCARVDKAHGLGDYAVKENKTDNTNNEDKKIDDNKHHHKHNKM